MSAMISDNDITVLNRWTAIINIKQYKHTRAHANKRWWLVLDMGDH